MFPRLVPLIALITLPIAATLAVWLRSDDRFSKLLQDFADDTALSLFEPHAGGCSWLQHEVASSHSKFITLFPNDCNDAHIAWHPAFTEALVWFGTEIDGMMLWHVSIKDGHRQRLPLPDAAEIVSFAFDEAGHALAFGIDYEINLVTRNGEVFIEHAGRLYQRSLTSEGDDMLVHAFVWRHERWQRIETVTARCCYEKTRNVIKLTSFAKLIDHPVSNVANNSLTAAALPTPDAAIQEKLHLFLPPTLKNQDGQWGVFPGDYDSKLYIWRQGEPLQFSGLVISEKENHWQVLPDLTFRYTDKLQVYQNGPYILFTEMPSGMRAHLYDRRQNRRVNFFEFSQAASFWPQTKQP